MAVRTVVERREWLFWVNWVLSITVALVVGWAMVGAAVAVLFVVTWDWDPGTGPAFKVPPGSTEISKTQTS